MVQIRFESGDTETAFDERFAVVCMLGKDNREIGHAEVNGGEAVGKVGAGQANNGVAKQAWVPPVAESNGDSVYVRIAGPEMRRMRCKTVVKKPGTHATSYTRAGVSTSVRVTEMTLMSSSCPNSCAERATSAAEDAVWSNWWTRSNPKRCPSASMASTTPSESRTSLSFCLSLKRMTEISSPGIMPRGNAPSTGIISPLR